ncbi:MAG TPA: glycosyltransferase [Prosthecobacter sp.]
MTTALYILAALYTLLLLLRWWLSHSYASRLPPAPKEPLPPGALTVAQAVLSGDPLLESRLVANLNALKDQTILWLIDENDREAVRLSEKLDRPNLVVQRCPPCPDATNPKLWKLRIAAPLVQTPFFAVVDDDTLLSAESAALLVEAAKTHTVATGLPCYMSKGLTSGLLAQFVNNNSVFTYLGTSRLLPPFTLNGMGYAMRTEELGRIGHFNPILHELTDDLALATLVLKQGGTIHQSAAPLQVQTGVRDLTHYWQMMHRWYVFTMLLLQRQRIPAQALIFVLHGLPPLLMVAMLVLVHLAGLSLSWLVVMGIVPLWFVRQQNYGPILAVILFRGFAAAAQQSLPLSTLALLLLMRGIILGEAQRKHFLKRLHRPFTSILSELIQPLHLIHSLCSRTIRWRTRLYKVRDTNDFHEVGG